MNVISQILLTTHVATGFLSLVLFWVPVIARKGGINHRKVGMVYVWCMSIVAATALILSVENLLQGRTDMALFLGFLSLLTGRPLVLGVECLKTKKGLTRRYHWLHTATSLVLVLAGIGLIIYSQVSNSPMSTLMIIFGILGLSVSKEVFDLAKYGSQKGYAIWMNDHITNMITAGIAAHTAFLVFGASSFIANTVSGGLAVVTWVAPSVIGTIGMIYARRRYCPKPKQNKATNTHPKAA